MSLYEDVWLNSDQNKKTSLVIGVLLVTVFTIGAFYLLLKADHKTLFSDLSARDASAIIEQLEEMKVEYMLEEGGEKILVSGDEVHDVRLKIMGSSLPIAGTVGFEIFNDTDFGMTEFAQKINFQRALQGELTRTIMSLNEVKFARVHLVLPENGLFKKDGMRASSSVVLFVKNNAVLSKRQISGIQQLVAASVPSMAINDVTVTDQNGETLTSKFSSSSQSISISKNLQIQKDVENYYADKINDLLEKHFDSADTHVSVNILLNYDQVKITRDGVVNDKGKVGSGVVREKESSTGDKGNYRKKRSAVKTKEVEYSLGRQIDQIVESPGRILKITVAVTLPENVSSERGRNIEKLISMAIGLDVSRGDDIAVYSIEGRIDEKKDGMSKSFVDEYEQYKSSTMDKDPHSEHLSPGIDTSKITINNNFVMIAFVVFILVIVILSVLLYRKNNSDSTESHRLSDSERKELLGKIKIWMADSKLAIQKDVAHE